MSLPTLKLTTDFADATEGRSRLKFTCIHVSNVSASPVAVFVCDCEPGASPTADNALIWGFDIQANSFLEFGEGIVLPRRHLLKAKADANDALVLKVSYSYT